MEPTPKFAVDIGGTLSKLAYIDSEPPSSDLDFATREGTVHLKIFNNNEISDLIAFLKSLNFCSSVLPMTGGGSYKYCDIFESSLHTKVHKVDEIESLALGFKIIMREVAIPAFYFTIDAGVVAVDPLTLPSILCNIGSGVSICKIGESIERITGTCVGGGTAVGLAAMMLGTNSYDELLQLCYKGDAKGVDLMFSDIDPDKGQDHLALSLGKLAIGHNSEFKREDIAKSIINTIAYNIGHVAYLAGKVEGISQVCFIGNFIRGYDYTMDRISFAVDYWSKGTASALFMKHDGYFGAVGSLFQTLSRQN